MKSLSYKGFMVYLGTPGWGWRMYGIGYGTIWFLGLSLAVEVIE